MQILNFLAPKKRGIFVKKSVAILFVSLLSFSLIAGEAFAADGSGINIVSPTSVVQNTTGNTFGFTFTAAETMDSGGITITVPSGWTTPQGTSGTAGYTTAASTGMIADVINAADVITNWQKGSCGSVALDTAVYHENGASVKCSNLAQGQNKAWQYYKLSSAVNWTAYTKVGFWVYSSVAIPSGTFNFAVSTANNLGSPKLANVTTAIAASTWTYIVLDISGLTRSSILSYGLYQTVSQTTINHANINIDDVLAGPGSITFPGGGVINARILQLSNPQTLSVTYGSGGGTSGVTAPSAVGVYTFTTQSRISDAGTLTNISSSPTVTVGYPVPVLTSISPTSTTAGGTNFTLTVNGSGFVASSTVYWNGSQRTTIYVNSSQLTATILSSDIAVGATSSVTVVTPSPGGGTSGSQTFTINNPVPTTTSISPTSTTAGGSGFALTINGTNFNASSTVNWNGSARTTTYISATQISASILASDIVSPGTASVMVVNPTPGGGTSNAQIFTINNPVPTTTSISPTSANVGDPGFVLTVNGTNFVASSTVQLNGSNRSTTYVSATQLSALILASDMNAAGTSTITVANPTPGGGISNSQTFTVNNLIPTTTSISPTSKNVGDSGFTLTIDGTNFISNSVVNFNGSPRVTTFASSTELTASILTFDLTTAGNFNITVTNPTPGGGTSNSQTFTVNNLIPTISLITPSIKNAGDPAFILTVNGTNFVSTSIVQWNGSSRTTTFASSTQLTASILSSDVAAAGTSTVTVFNSTPGGGASNGVTFTVASVATQFVILPPGNGTVDAPVSVTIQAQKSDGSVDTNYQNDVTLVTNGSATGGGLINIVNGVGTASISDHVAQTVNLSLSDSQSTGLSVTSTQSIIFSAGAVTQFIFNNPGNMDANTRLGYLVSRKDQYGNLVTSGATTAYLYTSSTSTSHGFYNDSLVGNLITSITIPDSSSTAQFWYYETTPGTYTITASDNATAPDGAAGIVDATSSVTVIPVATKFVIISATSTTVDSQITVTVQAQKPDNSIDTNYQNDVTLVTSGSATGGGLVAITNGVGTKQISDTVPETVHLSLSDTQSTGLNVSSTADVIFGVGAVAKFSLNDVVSVSAGQRAAYTVTRKDQYGNLVTSGTTTAYLYSSSSGLNKKFYDSATLGNIITSVQISNGQSSANFWYYDETLGTWTITVSDNASSPDGATGIQDAMDSINVVPGPVYAFYLNDPGNMTAGTRLGYIVTRKDQFGNLVTSGSSTVYLYSSATDASTAFYDAASGGSLITSIPITDTNSSANLWYTDNVVGTYTITASDNATAPDGATGIADGTDLVTVNAAPIVATKFVILPTTAGTVDGPITVTIQAQDNSGNLDTTATSSVTLITSGSATGGGLVTMVNGVGMIDISDHTAEIVNLSLSDTQHTGLNVSSVGAATFNPGAVAQFFLNNPGNMAAGTRLGFQLTRKDQYGNAVTLGSTASYLYSMSSGTYHFYDAASGGSSITSIDFVSGTSTVSFWYYDEKSATTTITASDNPTAPDGATGITDAASTFSVTPGPIYKFVLDDPGNMTAGTRLGYTVTREDQFNNLVTSGVVTAYLYSSSSGTTTAFYDAASGGGTESFVVFNNNQSSAPFWYFDETPGTWVVTVSDGTPTPNGTSGIQDAADTVVVSTVPIVPTRINIMPLSADYPVGAQMLVTVKVQDNSGNTDTLYHSSVTLATTGSAIGAGPMTITNGVGTIYISDPKLETITLSLQDTASTSLDVSSQQVVTFVITYGIATTQSVQGTGGLIPPIISGVQLSGKAFSGAKVSIVAIAGGEQTPMQQRSTASSNGTFAISAAGLPPGASSYAIVATDSSNRTTQVKIFGANLTDPSQLLRVQNILLSPTLGLIQSTITKGGFLGIIGSATPGYKIETEIDGQLISNITNADSNGNYKLLINTANLSFGSHTVRTRQVTPNYTKSDFSPQQAFSITKIFTPNMDFNNDGVIDIKDWSIFISRWNSTDPRVRILDDLNGDGKVDVQDFSIFVRTLQQ
jgi:hypothetical protein